MDHLCYQALPYSLARSPQVPKFPNQRHPRLHSDQTPEWASARLMPNQLGYASKSRSEEMEEHGLSELQNAKKRQGLLHRVPCRPLVMSLKNRGSRIRILRWASCIHDKAPVFRRTEAAKPLNPGKV